MRNISKPRGDFGREFSSIVAKKKKAEHKQALVECEELVIRRYKLYNKRRFALERIGKVTWSKEERAALKSCYDNSVAFHNALKKRHNITTDSPLPWCPYCQIEHATVWDHFLPTADFPEYYVLPLNIIRACVTCNGHKLHYGVKDPREVLNPYFDSIDLCRYLRCVVGVRGGTAGGLSAVFTVEPDSESVHYSADIEDIVQRHMDRLQLGRRITAESVRMTEELFRSARDWNRVTDAEIRQSVQEMIDRGNDAGAGLNDVRFLLYQALLELPDLGRYVI